jgi:hypothetical protein
MGVLPIVLMILAMKIPIFGLVWFAFWAGKMPEEAEGPAEENVRPHRPRRPQPPLGRGPRRRGPHGGGAQRALPCPAGARTHAVGPAARPLPATRHAPVLD